MAKRVTKENKRLFGKARRLLVGGVDSPVRGFGYVGGEPVLIRRAGASRVYDYDGNEYIDYVLSYGAMILGHSCPEVVRSVKKAADNGFAFGATNRQEIELAAVIRCAIPNMEKIRFVSSGAEAVMGAVRLARGYTERDEIVKFENAYHGHADYLLTKSAGVPKDFIKHTIIATLNDIEAIGRIFKSRGRKIAAVLVEPIGGNFGVVSPDKDFLKKLRTLTAKYGTLLIFDEVITGFRFRFGSIAPELNVVPDIVVLGKIIGGGFPIGAYGARDEIMKRLAPSGDVYQASTFAGNPITMQAGLATLKILERSKAGYRKSEDFARYLASRIEEEASSHGIPLKVSRYGNIFSIRFADVRKFKRFYHLMLDRGVYLAPSEFEANFLSFSHTRKDVEKTVDAAVSALEGI